MNAQDLCDLIIRSLIRTHGGSTNRWRRVLGELRLYPRETHPHCNWDARPSGGAADVATVEHIVDTLRADHPFIDR